jgi:hypothetical protein
MAPVACHPTPRPDRRARPTSPTGRREPATVLSVCTDPAGGLVDRANPCATVGLVAVLRFHMSLSARGDFWPGRFFGCCLCFPTALPLSKQRRGVHIGGLYQPPKEKTWLSVR